jgi:hypothetical protein
VGAEFTQVYARWRGAAIEPSSNAQWRAGAEDASPGKPVSRDTTLRGLTAAPRR